ncbi:hypothetical protein BWD42_03985 [Sphingobacterium sp. CZ-UAM]|nr:hypothetical protein BWD42_03985 [Sphingobacterium sp. CZ-UAM]
MSEWSNEQSWKDCIRDDCIEGSNPSLSAKQTVFNAVKNGFSVLSVIPAPKTAPKSNQRRKRFMRASSYKIPRIIRAKSGDWRVVYEYEIPGQIGAFKKFYVRDGINYIHDLQEKEIAAQELRDDIEEALKSGYNPFLAEIRTESKIFAEETEIKLNKEQSLPDAWNMKEAVENFIKYCQLKNLKDTTVKKYKSQTNTLLKWFTENEIDMKACEVDEDIILDFLEQYNEKFSWSARTYNNYIDGIVTLFTRLPRLERRRNKEIKYNIDLGYLEDKNAIAEKNRYYAPKVAELIKKEIKKDIELYRYVRWIFYSCMRPNEIRHLQIMHIDLDARQIKVAGGLGKTGDRFVPISNELFSLIKEMEVDKMPLDYYVFGSGKRPSPKKTFNEYFREKYRPIKVKLGLDKNYTLYSWKHTRVVSLITAGFDDNQVMTLTGHRDRTAFEAYKRDLVIDNSVMKGKTIDF